MKIPHEWQRVFDAICRVSMDYYDVRGGNPDNPGQFNSSGGSAGSKAIKQSKKSSGKQPLTAGSNKSIPQTHRSIVDALTAKKPKVNKNAQDKHANAGNAAAATRAEQKVSKPGAFVHPKSYFTIPMKSAHAKVINKIKNGEFTCESTGMAVPVLKIELDSPCGIAYDTKSKNPKKTNKVYVTCSAKGYHIYPVY